MAPRRCATNRVSANNAGGFIVKRLKIVYSQQFLKVLQRLKTRFESRKRAVKAEIEAGGTTLNDSQNA